MALSPATLVCDGKVVTQFTSPVAGVWSTNCGSLFTDAAATTPYAGGSASSVYYKAQNITSVGTISCTGDPTPAPITITGVFPAVPSFPYEWKPEKRGAVVNVKRNGAINGRLLGDGSLKLDYKLVMANNKLSDYEEVEAFWNNHYPNKTFKYVDGLRNFNKTLQFISVINVTAASHQRINYEVQTREA